LEYYRFPLQNFSGAFAVSFRECIDNLNKEKWKTSHDKMIFWHRKDDGFRVLQYPVMDAWRDF